MGKKKEQGSVNKNVVGRHKQLCSPSIFHFQVCLIALVNQRKAVELGKLCSPTTHSRVNIIKHLLLRRNCS